ncbi:MAG: DUF1223 domain-containing protein [Pseudomonadota bacterium]
MHKSLIALAAGLAATACAAAELCSVHTGSQRTTVVELYTSEGCSSCPPADRWLSSLRPGQGTVALAFHVDYWDRLGWVDRFASPRHTQRQYQRQQASGARFVYTPQVLLDGRDWRGWPATPPRSTVPAEVSVGLQRIGTEAVARVAPHAGAAVPEQLSGYWAVVEDGLVSRVKAGENAGATLRHDHVVRHYEPLVPWPAGQARQLRWPWPSAGRGQRVVLVVTDAATGLPLQAAELACDAVN